MKKKRLYIIIGILLMIGVCLIIFKTIGRKPFKSLTVSDVESATVHLSPPDKTLEIPDIAELVSYLNNVVIYEEDNSYTEYVGQGVTFTLVLSDGTQKKVVAYNPFMIIDGVGYKTKYKPCEALNAYANRLLYIE